MDLATDRVLPPQLIESQSQSTSAEPTFATQSVTDFCDRRCFSDEIRVTFKSHNCLAEVSCACAESSARRCMKAIPKTRPRNVTPFVLEGCWTLDALDQPTMRLLRRIADRERVKVADVIHGALELFVQNARLRPTSKKKLSNFRCR
jgi:hypothetical protein